MLSCKCSWEREREKKACIIKKKKLYKNWQKKLERAKEEKAESIIKEAKIHRCPEGVEAQFILLNNFSFPFETFIQGARKEV
jgi:hypothetical protein